MKWKIIDRSLSLLSKDELQKQFQKKGIASVILNSVLTTPSEKEDIEFISDDNNFIEKIIKDIICYCYKNDISLKEARDNGEEFFNSVKHQDDISSSDGKWFYSLGRITSNEEKMSMYCFSFSNRKKYCYLKLTQI